MKFLLGYVIFLGFLISFCNCNNFSISVDPYHKEIYKFVKQVITDWNQKHENNINDISIINIDNDTSLFHIVRNAVHKENCVLLPDCRGTDYYKYASTRKSSMFIIISKMFSNVFEYANQLLRCVDSGFWTPQTNVIVIPSGNVLNVNEIVYPYEILTKSRTLNFIIPYVEDGKIVDIFKGNILHLQTELTGIGIITNTTILFDNKFADMKGYSYKVIVNQNDMRLIAKNDKISLPEIQLMETIAEMQNATVNISLSDMQITKEFDIEIQQGSFDMILNFGYYSGVLDSSYSLSTINTYETNGYCALVPIEHDRNMFLRFVLYPFRSCVWSLMVLSILLGALIWHRFRKMSKNQMVPAYYFMYDILAVFIQQSVSIRKGRTIVKIMLQIFIFMTIVLTNVYQGMMTSILMDPLEHIELTSVQELMETNYEFHGDQLLLQIMNESEANWNITKRTKPLEIWLHNTEYIKQFQNLMTVKPNNVLIVGCDTVTELFETQIDERTKGCDVYYQLDQKILSYYENILLTRRSPFYEKLGEMSLRIENSASMLGMKEMVSVFRLFYCSASVACFILIFELSSNYFRLIYKCSVKKCLRRFRKYRNRKVAPRNQIIGKSQVASVEGKYVTILNHV